MKECETRKISYLIQRKTRRSTVASRTAMVGTATIAIRDDDDDVTGT